MKKNKLFTIGEISNIKGITVKALRFYERIGLIKPSYKAPSSNYRYYSIEQFVQLDIIKASRSMGISPKDIKVILDKKDNHMLLDFLKDQGKSIDMKIEELQRSRAIISMVKNYISSSLSSASNTEPFYKNIPSRYIVTLKLETIDEDIPLYYSKLYQLVDKLRLTSTYETGIIYSAVEGSVFYPSEVFNAVLEETGASKEDIKQIPGGRYLCICLNMQNAEEQQRKFNQYLAQNYLNPELILQTDLLNNIFDEGASCIEMQALLEREG